jgi:acyl-CoA reductase-like NAD-dependent aldehyde dehydrogenase
MAAMPAYARQAALQACVRRFEARQEELALALCIEAGKPIKDSRGEVTRLIDTFRVAAEEATRIVGEVLPLDISPRAQGYRGQWKRVPIGPVSLISPFNFPLNLAAHKIAPAIAAGCPFVLKPASLTPVGALLIGEVLARGRAAGGLVVDRAVPARGRDPADDRRAAQAAQSFTGSGEVGWALKAKAGKKKVVLELGGDAACIVDAGADLATVVPRLAFGAFYQSGQSCISVQRIFAHRSLYAAAAREAGRGRAGAQGRGPARRADHARAADQREGGAPGRALGAGGGRRRGDAAVRRHARRRDDAGDAARGRARELPLCTEEVFGPVAILAPFDDFEAALAAVNASKFGLQAGVFTNDLQHAYRAWDALEVGGVIINDVPSWRVDHMPYGGVKESGLGREGVRFAIEDMTEIRLLVLKL